MLSFKNHLLLNNIRNLNESSMWLKTVIGGIVIKIRSLDTQIQVSDDANEQNRLLSQQNKLLSYMSGLGIAFSSDNQQLISYMKSVGRRK
tara:strand:+ start:122 stop:391 length:270 start_codon:yes stop_codon:yes gene_type:complete